jgi:short-subunit dehydrogenase
MENLKGKVAVVTGAGSGIGRALAEQLAGEGCHLALADINEDALSKVATALRESGTRVSTHAVNVARREQMQQFVAEVIRQHTVVDLLINNAGVMLTQTTRDVSQEDLEWIMGINVWGVLHGTKLFLPHLLERERARIVNISSILGLMGSAAAPVYCLTKFAVRGFTEGLRLELAGTNVGVTCVYPGGVRTNLFNNSRVYKDFVDPTIDRPDKSASAERFNQAFGLSGPAQAARTIVEGIKRNKERVLIGRDARFVDLVTRLLPLKYPPLVGHFYQWFNGQTQAPPVPVTQAQR